MVRCKMEKIEDHHVIIFSCTTLTLACAVDMLCNEKAKRIKKSKNVDERLAS